MLCYVLLKYYIDT